MDRSIVLGLNAYHADASACLVIDGQLIAAAEEERFRRIKHWAGLPTEAVRACLREAKVEIQDIDHIAINRNPGANLLKKALYAFSKRPGLETIRDRLSNANKVRDVKALLGEALGERREARGERGEARGGRREAGGVRGDEIRAKVHQVEHHRAHLASSFLVSPFESAAVASVDGFGDFVSTMWGVGEGSKVEVRGNVTFPHSLGLFYLAMTQYLGFPGYGDEYKVMGLAAYGKPEYLEALRRIVRLKPKGWFELNLDYFLHHSEGVSMTWESGAPVIGRVFSDELVQLLGPPREQDGPVTSRHENLAASFQAMYEEAFFHIVNNLYERTHQKTLCLAGGCALNSVANGQITQRTPFERIYVPPAAGDAGGAIGAAFSVWHEELGKPRSFVMDRADWGPSFSEVEIREAVGGRGEARGGRREARGGRGEALVGGSEERGGRREALEKEGCVIIEMKDEEELCRKTAEEIAAGKIVGWFQGRMEWGARALGQRSILADPRRPEMKDILNARIKKREAFRPFAPSILDEAVGDYFELTAPSPFMTMTYRVKPDKRDAIPAPTHVDGTGRLQTVTRQAQPLYWKLIKAFESLTGVPVLLNTSFNENEPIVCAPAEALDCFLRTKMDVLVMGKWIVMRTER